jgi:uncharacterized protein YozE (UPF0346 family)
MSTKPSDFKEWLLRLVDESSPVGHLACDVRDDDTWPDDEPESFELLAEYLESQGAIPAAVDAFEEAWRRYSRYAGLDA